ncbi:hypothetical protein NKR23_g9214 [Pleurostoma richardsiae]|uniref:Uncharacterized protein n=1 Tax=Pleurostoma richardsiae TaxID=41990 RepID=A0AA38R4V8_9PEZI|nr:hypothetical protein NKR23_g9214 [Pleurostoma richardsiae]
MRPQWSTHVEKLWDPEEVLTITNPATGSPTCLGEAVTYGRRCQRHIAANKFANVWRILDGIAQEDAFTAAKSSELMEALSWGLCYQHKQQAEQIQRRWIRQLREWSGDSQRSSYAAGPGPSAAWPQSDKRDFKRGFGSKAGQTPSTAPSYSTRPMFGYGMKYEDQAEEMGRKMRQMAEELEKLRRDAEAWRRAEREREESERLRRKEEEMRRQKKEEEERQKREKEQKERAERLKREQEERQRREKEQKERQKKEEAARARERPRTRAQERERAMKKEWEDAWTRYTDGWDKIRGKTSEEVDHAQIPWPVKSGRLEDVTSGNVSLFFERAPPIALAIDVAEERFRIISQENKRWHTDKIMSQFGPEILSGKYKDALDLIAKLMVQLWKEAKMKRNC